ncbi:MAG: sulfotransferase family 2 domain-containing protein [Verrucomicrobiota bacterium]
MNSLARKMGILQRAKHDLHRLRYRRAFPEQFNDWVALRSETGPGVTLRSYDELRCIFVHIPKAAGLSVARTLFENDGGSHLRLVDYAVIFGAADFNRYFKFTFVRHPETRLASAFTFLKNGGANARDAEWATQIKLPETDFKTFVRRLADEPKLLRWKHLTPQSEFLTMNGSTEHLDYVGRFEQLNKDFEFVAERLDRKVSLRQENVTKKTGTDYESLYDGETRRIVRDVYRIDFEHFGYE